MSEDQSLHYIHDTRDQCYRPAVIQCHWVGLRQWESGGAGSGCRGGAGVLHTAFSTLGPMSSGSAGLPFLSFSTILSPEWLCWLVWLTGGVVVSGAVMQGGMEGDGGQSDGGLLEECGGVRGAQIVWCDDVWAGGGGVKPVVLTRLLYAHLPQFHPHLQWFFSALSSRPCNLCSNFLQ